MNQITPLIKTFTPAVTPAQAGAYTHHCAQDVAGCGISCLSLDRMGPGLRRGDVGGLA
jgi:hypothetical protein